MDERKSTKIGIVALLMVFFLLFALPQEAGAEYRIALVIGNGAYGAEMGPLSDPPNDAVLIAKTLRNLRFTVEDRTDVDRKTMKRLIRDFGSKLKAQKDAVGLFYYSGHGMQVGGRNYMIPVGVIIKDESDVEDDGVGVDYILSKMREAGNTTNIVILDACRDNRFEKSFKSAAKGLNRMDTPKGTLLAFAAEPHKVALQGPGNYSYFTESLAQEIVKPDISAIEMLREVRKKVLAKTNGQQFPVVEDRLLAGFYFAPQSVGSYKLSALRPSVRQTAEPPSEQATHRAQLRDFSSIIGVSYSSSRDDIVRMLGEPDPLLEIVRKLRRKYGQPEELPDDSLSYKDLGVLFDITAEGRVTGVRLKYKGSVNRLKKKGIVDPKLDYVGMSLSEIQTLLGKPESTYVEESAQHRQLVYEFVVDSDVIATVVFYVDKYSKECDWMWVEWHKKIF